MAGEHVLAILATGAGKSLCYQLPALSRYDKTGALTVVISPLVALMADQVPAWRLAASAPASPSTGCCPCRRGPMRWTGCGWGTPAFS